MDTLTSIRAFCAVAELRRFRAAADRLGMSPAMVSKHIAGLEQRLGARLLDRNSRHVSLTVEGRLYFERVQPMIDGLDELDTEMGSATEVAKGTIRLTAPVWMANPLFAEVLAGFQRRHPAVRFDIDLSGRLVNLIEEGFDLALRATDSLDPALVARPIADIEFVLVAAPGYLARAGRPATVDALSGHALLAFSGMAINNGLPLLQVGQQTQLRFVPMMFSHNEIMLRLAALEGMGMAFLPRLLVAEHLASGALEHVLPDAVSHSKTLYAVYPSRRFVSGKLRSFLAFLAKSKLAQAG